MSEASIPNPALGSWGILVGEWVTVGTHPHMPDVTLHGRTVFEWLEGGAFLMMRSEIDEPGIPSGLAIFGTDDVKGECSMLYFDERGVSRNYDASLDGNVLEWWRDDPGFSQRFVCTITDDGRSMVGTGEFSKDGGPWEPDLALTYTRVR
jgi:hypothetical protein